ncbi:bifunctional 3-(3-hydroxy-phenyl)propionate/3-hydroxycinnamic acid hydroxylase MhpA [Streptomyces sp. NPDC055025]
MSAQTTPTPTGAATVATGVTIPTPTDVVTVATDVAIVGYGPIGQTLAILLAQRGWDVTVVERYPKPFPLPRAVTFDGESARILASAGLDPSLGEYGKPTGDYGWQNGDGLELLLFTGIGDIGPQGWPITTSYYQPGLESALIARGAELPGLRVLRGYEAKEITDDGTGVDVVAESATGGRLALRARCLVGCDGANSVVRAGMGAAFTELGFSHDWLTCDVTLDAPRDFDPDNLQTCDPARPRTSVSAGPGHRRWEFMRVPGETVEELDSVESAWRLLALDGVTPGNATLDRYAVYTFKAGHADRWRAGRVMLAGDAAHLMPPFAGQGMSSGFRDAANLSWKLHLVLDGRAREGILDTYTTERREHVQYAITKSVELGRIICEPDPAVARERDKKMLAAKEEVGGSDGLVLEIRPLTDGLLHRPGDGATGHLFPQGRVTRLLPQGRVTRPGAPGEGTTAEGAPGEGVTGRYDEVVGHGFSLITLVPPGELLDGDRLAFLGTLDASVVHVLPSGSGPDSVPGSVVVDTDDVYVPHLAGLPATAVLVRPDFYVFGAARDRDSAAALIDDLRTQLSRPERG